MGCYRPDGGRQLDGDAIGRRRSRLGDAHVGTRRGATRQVRRRGEMEQFTEAGAGRGDHDLLTGIEHLVGREVQRASSDPGSATASTRKAPRRLDRRREPPLEA